MTRNWAPAGNLHLQGVTLATVTGHLAQRELRIVQLTPGYSISQGCREKMMDSHALRSKMQTDTSPYQPATIFPADSNCNPTTIGLEAFCRKGKRVRHQHAAFFRKPLRLMEPVKRRLEG